MELVALAVAFAVGADPRRVVLVGFGLQFPLVIVALAVVGIVKARAETSLAPLFCEGVAAELRAGSTTRDALANAADSVNLGGSQLSRELPIADLTRILKDEFPDIGSELEMVISSAVVNGSSSADLFDEIGGVAVAEAEIGHEVRVSTAPARVTGLIFAVAPMFLLLSRRHDLAALGANPSQRGALVVGSLLFVLGLGLALAMLVRSR